MAKETPPPPGLDQYLNGTQGPMMNGGDQGEPPGIDEYLRPELLEEKYGNPLEMAKTAGEGALSSATLGFGTGLEEKLFNNAQEIRDRREANPGSHMVGQIAGLVAPAAIGIPGVAGGMAEAGNFAAKAAGLGAEGAGVASRIGASAVKNAVEATIFQGGDEVSKMFSQDPAYAGKAPSEAAQTAIVNMGLGGLLGGALGGFTGAGGELWNATIGKRLGGTLEAAAHEIEAPASAPPAPIELDDFGTPIEPTVLNGSDEDLIKGAMRAPKKNVGQIQEDAALLGVKPTTGMLAEDKFIQNIEGNLVKSPTYGGQAAAKQTQAVYDGLEKNIGTLTRDSTLKTEAQVGREIKEGIKSTLEKEIKPIEAEYQSLKPELKKATFSQGDLVQHGSKILDHEYANLEASPELRDLAQGWFERVKSLKNLDEAKTLRTIVNEELSKAYRSGGGPETQILQTVKDALTDLRESGLQGSAARGEIAPETLSRIHGADAAYKAYKDKLKSFGVEAGVGNIGSARHLLEKFGKLSDESFATRVFDLNDVNQLGFFKQNFPKEFELARRYKLRELIEKATSEARGKNGAIDIGRFLSQTADKNMNPEARAALFGEGGAQKLEAIRRLYRTIPADPNPSGTHAAGLFSNLFSLKGFVRNTGDAAQYALLKAKPYLEEASKAAGGGQAGELAAATLASQIEKGANPAAFQQMATFIGKTIKGENLLSKATKGIFEAGMDVLPSKFIPSDKDREKLDEVLKEAQVDPNILMNSSGQVGHYMPSHGMAISQTAASAVNYLNSLRPIQPIMGPLDEKPKMSKAQMFPFNRALDIAQQPLIVLQGVKHGTVTHEDIVHFQNLYPALYQKTSDKLFQNMVTALSKGKKVPYKTKMGLSLFLAQPLDGTMTPSSIMAAQPKPKNMGPPQQGPGQTSQPKHSMKGLDKLAIGTMTLDQARQARHLKQ